MNPLNSFYLDVHQREAVKAFMIEQLAQATVDKAFNNQSTEGIYEAKQLVDKMFETLDEMFGKKEKPVITSMR